MRHDRGQDQGCGDEADIAHRKIHGFADLIEGQMARVDAFVHHHARIVAQFPVELSVPDVDGMHADRSVLQQAIGEAAGGRADIQAN